MVSFSFFFAKITIAIMEKLYVSTLLHLEDFGMAKEVVKAKKAKMSPWKFVGEALQFVGCPPVKIGQWISEAADKKAAQKEAAGNETVAEKNEKREADIKEAEELKAEGKSFEKIAEEIGVEKVEVKEKKNESNET